MPFAVLSKIGTNQLQQHYKENALVELFCYDYKAYYKKKFQGKFCENFGQDGKSGQRPTKISRDPYRSCAVRGTNSTPTVLKKEIQINPSDPICVRTHLASSDKLTLALLIICYRYGLTKLRVRKYPPFKQDYSHFVRFESLFIRIRVT